MTTVSQVEAKQTLRELTVKQVWSELQHWIQAGYGDSLLEYERTTGMARTTCTLVVRKTVPLMGQPNA